MRPNWNNTVLTEISLSVRIRTDVQNLTVSSGNGHKYQKSGGTVRNLTQVFKIGR